MFEIIYTDKVYIEGFKSSNNRVIDHFIKKNKSKFISYIKHNNTIDCSINIEDLFFETLSDLWENIVHDTYQYQEKASLSTYFFSIVINKLRKEISRTQKISRQTEDEFDKNQNEPESKDIYELESKEECISLIKNKLNLFFSASSNCAIIIKKICIEEIKLKHVAEELGLKYNSIKTAKNRCINQLTKKIYDALQKQNPNNYLLLK